jgi:hypothetical protein
MADQLIESVVTIALAIVGLAILAVLVSRNAQTPAVLMAAGGAFSQSLQAAEAPVAGGYLNAPGYGAYY